MNLTSNELYELRTLCGLPVGIVTYKPQLVENSGAEFRQLHTGRYVKFLVENDTIIVSNVSELLCG